MLPTLSIISILIYAHPTCVKWDVWIGYKNPCTWEKKMCKFKIYQVQENRLGHILHHIYVWWVWRGKNILTQF
jgi:hypothetical protein